MQIIAHRKYRQRHSCLKSAFWEGNNFGHERYVAWHLGFVSSLNTGRAASIDVLGEMQEGKTQRASLKSATCGFYCNTKYLGAVAGAVARMLEKWLRETVHL